jgi:ketosteroid isomerase-like protein
MTTKDNAATTPDAAHAVAQLQRRWILEGWEKQPGEHFVFKDKVGHFYDWNNPATSLHDTFDPKLRVARSPQEWADAFEAPFDAMHSALHVVIDEPDVLVSGEIASATFQFCARLEAADGKVTGALCRTSHVWGFKDGQWTIIREHTSCQTGPLEQVHALLGKFEPQKQF